MTKLWWKAAGIRALKTFCQGLVTFIGSKAINIVEIPWLTILGMSATMAVVSLLTSIAGLPEVDMEEQQREDAPSHDNALEPDENDGVGDTDEGVM